MKSMKPRDTAFQASAGAGNTAQKPMDDQSVTRALPKREIRCETPSIAANAPPDAPNNDSPNTEFETFNERCMAGIRASQLETIIPWIRKTSETETRAALSTKAQLGGDTGHPATRASP